MFPVGSFDETKPNEGFTMEQVVKFEFHESPEIPIFRGTREALSEL